MKFQLTAPAVAAAALLSLMPWSARAAVKNWDGSGGDANWATAGNWGGTAPVNADNLVFSGTIQPNNTNNISGLNAGWVTFNNAGFTLNGNALTVSGSTTAFFTNLAGANTLACPLITTAPGGRYWFVAPNSEIRLTGTLTNTAASGSSVGWLSLTNGGTVRILNKAQGSRGMDLFQGAVIVDGGLVEAFDDGIRLKPPTGNTVAVVLTNNGTLRVGGGGNVRLGNGGTGIGAAAGAGSTSRLDISSGTLELYGSAVTIYVSDNVAGVVAVVNQNGGVVWGSAGSGNTVTFGNATSPSGTYNLSGGLLWIGQIKQVNSGANAFNFNGGTLKPTVSTTSFMQGLDAANVLAGGAIIDTTNLDITMGQALQGVGGLVKRGAGTLSLTGANTYTGATVVSNGTLNIVGSVAGSVAVMAGTLSGSGTVAGAVTLQSGSTLSPGGVAGAPVTLTLKSELTLAGNLKVQVNKAASPASDLVTVSGTPVNTGTGTLTVVNAGTALAAGDSFQVFSRPLLNGGALTFSPTVPGAGLLWTNRLALDGSIGVVAAPAEVTANLSGLTLSAGTLAPVFNSNTLSYAASSAYTNSLLTLTPTSATAGATIRVMANGLTNLVASGEASSPVALRPGTNVITVQVTAPDGLASQSYAVTFTRIQPNIVVILADDQGFSDWSCYGSEIATPQLDGLAAGGLRFRQFYNCARCSPTRCALLTGLYTAQVAVDPLQALPNLRNDNNVTIAELLGANGYRTYMSGKWHLGNGAYLPEARGFDQVWRYVNGVDHSEDTWNTNRYTLVSSNGEITNRFYAAGQFYQPDAIGDYSLDFINNDQVIHGGDKPFFLYMAFGSAHFPIQAPKDWVDTNAPIYTNGWDYVRQWRYTNQLAKGVLDGRTALSPNQGTLPFGNVGAEAIPEWTNLPADRQADLARRMAIYAAMVQKMDANIGRVVQRLKELGQLDNTLIFALSDNGGNYEGSVFGQTGGVNDPTPLTGTDLDNMGLNGQPVIYLGGGWAHLNNTPFRFFKHFDHEGGIRTPLIVHWPQGLTRTNQWAGQVGHLIDIMATIVDVTGVSYPTQFANEVLQTNYAVLPLEGQSLRPWFTGTNDGPRTLGFEHESNRAWLNGHWKFVTKQFTSLDGSSAANTPELYDLSVDPTELTNLATAQPKFLAQMVTNWNAWATRVGLSARLYNLSAMLPAVTPAATDRDLLVDTFNRPDATNADASAAGMWGSRVPPLGVDATYSEGWEGSGLPTSIQVLSSNLQMAVGAGMSENGLMHNFTGSDIVAAGGFSIELTVQEINSATSDSANRYVGFGVGLSAAEAAAGGDVGATSGTLFRGETGNNNLGVADFFVELDINGNIKVWNNGVLLDTVAVGQNYGTLTARYACTGFTTDDTVTVSVFFNGQPVDINTADANSLSRTFKWDRNNSNYIGLSARASNYARMDNLAIRKLPLAGDLAMDYAMRFGLSGTNADSAADPDGDGVSNLGEWAFGGDPTAADPLIAGLKGILITPTRDFQFDYQRLTDAAAYGVQYHYFVSEDMITWTETTPIQVNVASNEDYPGYEIVTMQLPASAIAGKEHLFLRVRVEPF